MRAALLRLPSLPMALIILCSALSPAVPANALSYASGFIPVPPDNFSLYRTSHFDVYYDPAHAGDISGILADADYAYSTVSAFFGTYGYRTKIILATDHGQYTNILNVDSMPENSIASGWGDGDTGTVVIEYDRRTLDYRTVLVHEMTHIAMRSYINGYKYKVPEWFSEGLAVYVSGDISPISRGVIEDDCRQDKLMSISTLESLHERSTDPDTNVNDLSKAYTESGMIIEYIAQKYGNGTVKRILADFGPTGDLDRAFVDVIGHTPDGLSSDWSRDLKHELGVRDGIILNDQVYGRVVDHKGLPVANQTIAFTSLRNDSAVQGKTYTAMTNATGDYRVNATYGLMKVHTEKPGYVSVDNTFELRRDQVLSMDLLLNGSASEMATASVRAEASRNTTTYAVIAIINIIAVALLLILFRHTRR